MKQIIVILTIMASLFIGCKPSKPQNGMVVKPNAVVVDSNGYKYRFVRPEMVVNGMTQVELWERIDPLVTNRWYTPTLASKFDTNHPPTFNSLMK